MSKQSSFGATYTPACHRSLVADSLVPHLVNSMLQRIITYNAL